MPVIEENTGFIYCIEVNLDDVVVIRLVGLQGGSYGSGERGKRGSVGPG